MTKKTNLYTITAASILIFAFAPAAYANNYGGITSYNGSSSTYNSYSSSSIRGQHFNPNFSGTAVKPRILNGSSTASYYYRVGVSQFEKGNFEKAERAFEAVLRAKGLNKQALYYLTQISEKQGDDAKLTKYAQAYDDLNK